MPFNRPQFEVSSLPEAPPSFDKWGGSFCHLSERDRTNREITPGIKNDSRLRSSLSNLIRLAKRVVLGPQTGKNVLLSSAVGDHRMLEAD